MEINYKETDVFGSPRYVLEKFCDKFCLWDFFEGKFVNPIIQQEFLNSIKERK